MCSLTRRLTKTASTQRTTDFNKTQCSSATRTRKGQRRALQHRLFEQGTINFTCSGHSATASMVRSWDRCVGDVNITAPRELVASNPENTFSSVSEADTGCFNGLLLNVHTLRHRCSVSNPHGPDTDPWKSCFKRQESQSTHRGETAGRSNHVDGGLQRFYVWSHSDYTNLFM